MNANEARRLAYSHSPFLHCVEAFDEYIKKEATNGKYAVTINANMKLDEKTIMAIKNFYIKKGFKVTYQINSPSNIAIFHIDWTTPTRRSLFLRLKEVLKAGLVSYPR